MPYITEDQRTDLDDYIYDVVATIEAQAVAGKEVGSVNYAITEIVMQTLVGDEPSYKKFNEAIGVLECAKLELYRRAVALYEDKAIEKNGDIESYKGKC